MHLGIVPQALEDDELVLLRAHVGAAVLRSRGGEHQQTYSRICHDGSNGAPQPKRRQMLAKIAMCLQVVPLKVRAGRLRMSLIGTAARFRLFSRISETPNSCNSADR